MSLLLFQSTGHSEEESQVTQPKDFHMEAVKMGLVSLASYFSESQTGEANPNPDPCPRISTLK